MHLLVAVPQLPTLRSLNHGEGSDKTAWGLGYAPFQKQSSVRSLANDPLIAMELLFIGRGLANSHLIAASGRDGRDESNEL